MLLRITELGTRDDHRFYSVTTPRGLSGIVDMTGADRTVSLCLEGTCYHREYPASGEIGADPPKIADLEGGYQTLQTFVSCWEHSTPEQREDLLDYNLKPLYTYTKNGQDRRNKRKMILSEDRPVYVPATEADTWYRTRAADLRKALKGTTAAAPIRIGHITVKRSVLWALFDTKSALTLDPIVELHPEQDSLRIRSADARAQVTVKHGAGDKAKGAYGYVRRIAFVPSQA